MMNREGASEKRQEAPTIALTRAKTARIIETTFGFRQEQRGMMEFRQVFMAVTMGNSMRQGGLR